MKPKPLTLPAGIIRALLERGEIQHRVPLSPQPGIAVLCSRDECSRTCLQRCFECGELDCCDNLLPGIRFPIGSTWWVREAWVLSRHANGSNCSMLFYVGNSSAGVAPPYLWCYSKDAQSFSHLTVEVTANHVERLQAMNWEDALAEGVPYEMCCNGEACACKGLPIGNPLSDFVLAWNSRYAKKSLGWDANPWVAVPTFRVQEKDDGKRATFAG